MDAGLLFIALDVPYLLLGPLAGWAVDKYGTKPAAVLGFGYLVPTLALLRLAHPGGEEQIMLYSALLALCGIGMAVTGAPAIVEASNVIQKYDKANPKFFREQGPYAQLYGFNSIFFCAGLTVGPILAGALRDSIGYGNMNAVAAAMSGGIAVLSFVFIGGTPKFLRRKRR
jgi:MFS family permease